MSAPFGWHKIPPEVTVDTMPGDARFRWFENSRLTHNLYWRGLYVGAVLSDYPKVTWRAWVQDCEDCSLVGVYSTADEAKSALLAKVKEITDAI